MPKVPSVGLLALALAVSLVFAGYLPVEKDRPDPGSSTPEANSASDWEYESTRIAMPESGGDTADSRDAADLSETWNQENKTSPAIGPGTLCDTLVASAQANGLPIVFFSNLIWQESRFHPDAVSRAGALGIAQFMPKTAAAVGLENPLDPQQALPASARLLATLYREFGNWGLAAAAYNAGGKRVTDWLSKGTVLPKETRDYVLTITGRPVEQWSPSNSESSALVPAKKMPCRDVAGFTAAAANAGATSHEPLAAEKSDVESPRVADVLQSARPTGRETLLSRVGDMRERWAGLRKHWAALSASGHSPAELPMDVGLAQTKKTSPKKPTGAGDTSPKLIRVGDASPKLIRIGDASSKLIRIGDPSPKPIRVGDVSPKLIRVGDASPKLIRVGDASQKSIRVADASPEANHKGKLERPAKRRHSVTSS